MANASTQKDLTPVNATVATPSLGEAYAKVTHTDRHLRTHDQVHIAAQPDLFVCCHELMCSLETKHMYFPLVKARKKPMLSS